MKIFLPVFGICALLLSGCCHTRYDYKSPGGAVVSVVNDRLFWTTDAYAVNFSTNGAASISVTKSSTDKEAVGAVAQGVASAFINAAPK